MKIAIVGSGISGLTAGWLISKAGHQVSLFEKHAYLGMDAHSVSLPDHFSCQAPAGLNPNRIDVPPRLFNPQLWPNVVRLYQEAGIETCPIDPTKTFSDEENVSYLSRLSGYRPALADLLRQEVRSIASDAKRLLDACRQWEANGDLPRVSLNQFWQDHDYSRTFIYSFLYPALGSTVCTCDYQTLDNYPVEIVFSALLKMVDGDPLRRSRWGSQDVVARLSKPIDTIQLNSTVSSAYRSKDRTRVQLQINGVAESFDHLIVATQANHVTNVVSDLGETETNLLQSFGYVSAPVIVHTDSTMMPASEKHWSHFNMQRAKTSELTADDSNCATPSAQCTMWINRFREDGNHQANLFQTIMPIRQPAADSVLATGNLQRPTVTMKSFDAWQQWQDMLKESDRRIWFCGSYAVLGIPLLESGVKSSLQVAQAITGQSLLG